MRAILFLPLLAVVSAVLFVTMGTSSVAALDTGGACNASGLSKSPLCDAATQNEDVRTDFVGPIVNLILFALGAAAVVVIVIGGIRYATSNGDASQIQSAKNTIMYAVVGLVVAIMAGGIVNFIMSSFDGGSFTGGAVSGTQQQGPGVVGGQKPSSVDPCVAVGGVQSGGRCTHPCEANTSSCSANLRTDYVSKCQATGKSQADCIGTAPAP